MKTKNETSSALRDAIMKILYEEAPNTPWLSDVFYDKLLSLIEMEKNRDVNVYPHQHTWKIVDDITLHGKAKWVACSECGKLDCDFIDEALGLVRSTAKGALVASERDKNAMQKAMKAIGLLNSMVAGGEEHSETSKKLVEGAVVDLLHAMQFKVEETKNGSQLSV